MTGHMDRAAGDGNVLDAGLGLHVAIHAGTQTGCFSVPGQRACGSTVDHTAGDRNALQSACRTGTDTGRKVTAGGIDGTALKTSLKWVALKLCPDFSRTL